ncbi:MAG: hypothetical protein SGILL_002170 [Bacillariaceae sp.]
MPPPPRGAPKKKKKKGHAPAHQNKYAFKHNPKSKLTDKIMSSPNIHVCQRCCEKIEWRKQYRKYKPRTQPGICNGCKKRNVLSAYHTICTNCTRDCTKAKEVIRDELDRQASKKRPQEAQSAGEEEEARHDKVPTAVAATTNIRACAVCVKEIALPDPEDDGDENDLAEGVGRIRLRERRAMERKLAKEAEKSRSRKGDDDDENGDVDEESSIPHSVHSGDEGDGFDAEDPFLKAVGGTDQLLTGEAYQQKLLRQQQQV